MPSAVPSWDPSASPTSAPSVSPSQEPSEDDIIISYCFDIDANKVQKIRTDQDFTDHIVVMFHLTHVMSSSNHRKIK